MGDRNQAVEPGAALARPEADSISKVFWQKTGCERRDGKAMGVTGGTPSIPSYQITNVVQCRTGRQCAQSGSVGRRAMDGWRGRRRAICSLPACPAQAGFDSRQTLPARSTPLAREKKQAQSSAESAHAGAARLFTRASGRRRRKASGRVTSRVGAAVSSAQRCPAGTPGSGIAEGQPGTAAGPRAIRRHGGKIEASVPRPKSTPLSKPTGAARGAAQAWPMDGRASAAPRAVRLAPGGRGPGGGTRSTTGGADGATRAGQGWPLHGSCRERRQTAHLVGPGGNGHDDRSSLYPAVGIGAARQKRRCSTGQAATKCSRVTLSVCL